ncbi:MAG: hypothetical protein AAGC95_13960 [Pseudomonadota bacterium]
MTNRNWLLAVFGIFTLSAPASASDHLIPEASVFTQNYHAPTYSLYAKRLSRMSGINVFGNVFVAPAFENAFTVHFEEEEDEYTLVCMELEIGLYAYQLLAEMRAGTVKYETKEETLQQIDELEQNLPADVMDVEAKVIEVPLPSELGTELTRTWGQMLYQTRYPETDLAEEGYASFTPGEDGTYHHFSFFHGSMPLSGWIWDYPPNGRVAKLVEIVRVAKSTCNNDEARDLSALESSVAKLSQELSND